MAINPIPQNNLELFKKQQAQTANSNMQGKLPNVGVVDVPELSKTPIQDTLQKREQEATPAKPKGKRGKDKGAASIKLDILAVIACFVGIALAVLKKKKP